VPGRNHGHAVYRVSRAGELHRVRQSILGQVVTAVPCRRCGGSGEVISSPCSDCRGDGRVSEARTFTVDVPAGVDHASTLRLSGRGPAGPRGGPPGDLYVHLAVRPDDVFTRSVKSCTPTCTCRSPRPLLGATPEFETLDGAETLAVHPGTQTGHLIRLRGRGVPHVRGGAGRSRRPGRGGHSDAAVEGAGGPSPAVRGGERGGRRPPRRGPHVSPALRIRLIAGALRTPDASADRWSGDDSVTPAALGAVAQVFVDDLDALDVAPDDEHHLAHVLRLRPGETVVASDGSVGGARAGSPASPSAPTSLLRFSRRTGRS